MEISGFIAALSGALFAGAAIYVNLVEHPARLECGTEIAATVFGPSYRRAAVMQASLALLSTLVGVATWALGGSSLWLVGAAAIFAVVPFTFLAIMPTNNKLLDARLDRGAESTRNLLLQWGRLHAVRSALGLAAACIFLYSLGSG